MAPVEPHAVLLGIHGKKLCLACVKVGDEIQLQLEVSTCLVTATPTRTCMRWHVLFLRAVWDLPGYSISREVARPVLQVLASNRDYSQITHLLNVCLHHTAHVPLAKAGHMTESASMGEGAIQDGPQEDAHLGTSISGAALLSKGLQPTKTRPLSVKPHADLSLPVLGCSDPWAGMPSGPCTP